ncbi:MAG: hypothetical protein ACXIUP_08190 [Microcella sp.]
MTTPRTISRPTILLAAAALALTGCAAADPDDAAEPTGNGAVVDTDGAPSDGAETTDEPGDAQASGGGVLDSLDAPELHTGIEPADPGTAYLVVDGTRLDFTIESCDLLATDAGERHIGFATGDTELGPAQLRWDRSIGDGVGWAWIDEYLQLSIEDAGTDPTRYSNSIIQLEQDVDGTVRWDHGSAAELPILRVQGPLATTAGELDAAPVADAPLTGVFTGSMHCG